MENAYPTHLHHHDHLEDLILSNQIGGGFRDTLSSIHTNTANVTAAVDRAGLAAVTETARNGAANLAAVERNGGETRTSVERNAGEINAHMDRVQIALLGELCDIRKEASDNKADIMLDACKNTHALTLQAAQNAADASRQLAECCCEMKELVRAENTATREQIAANEQTRLRDALNAANQSLLLLRVGNGDNIGG